MRLLIDTNIITYALREREPVLSGFIKALKADNVFVSSDVVDYETRRRPSSKTAGAPSEEGRPRRAAPTAMRRRG